MQHLNDIGSDWLADEVDGLTDHIEHMTPVEFNEQTRYLPESVTPLPGFIRYDVFPFLREIVNCFGLHGIAAGIREVNLMKGVQVGYTTALESVLLYYIAWIKTVPTMLISADKELVDLRIENYILPMLKHSDLDHLIRSSDEGNSRKTGKTKNQLQWVGGGFLIPLGAQNANKMRMVSILLSLKDEIDGWPLKVGRDGDPDKLTDDRCAAYWERRKIFRGSTPLEMNTSKIKKAHDKGDKRVYMVPCKHCGHMQQLRWKTTDTETGVVGGMMWDMDDGVLIPESVRFCCAKCGGAHHEQDKEKLFAEESGAHWHPTARPLEPGIRSYHLSALYSPIGFQPWSKSVASYLEAWDVEGNKVKDIEKYKVFYNNVLGEPFRVQGSRVMFASVSAHRRAVYRLGEIPNKYAAQFSGSKILFLTVTVDVHKSNLAVTVWGWTKDLRSYVIDYWRFEVTSDEDDCTETTSPVWGRLRKLIEETVYTADDGTQYRILTSLIDAGYSNDTVTSFCSVYASGVYPILGRDRTAKNQSIREFAEFKTQSGTVGYRILVDHYKDRLAPVLRREWVEDAGIQDRYHFNAPVDITDKQLKELTVETRREETDANGHTAYKWHRPGNARNELWDLLVYGHASVEILAYAICIQHFELETVDWHQFWEFAALPENDAAFGRVGG